MFRLDKIDEKIISILKIDSRKAFIEIAQIVGLSESAVRRRIRNLIDNNIRCFYERNLSYGETNTYIPTLDELE